MTDSAKLIVTIPFGPASSLEFALDTIQSVLHFTSQGTKIIIADDSGANAGTHLLHEYPDLVVVRPPSAGGVAGGLYIALSHAYLQAHLRYRFQVLLKLDVDALVVGERPEDDAIRYFEENPGVGLAGSYRVDCNGDLRDFSWGARELYFETATPRGLLQDPRRFMTLRKLLLQALAHGYLPGEHVQGGACFYSGEAIRRLADANLLCREELRTCRLAEDPIFSLLVRSLGMQLGDFATGQLPMGIRWRGLPCSPPELVRRGKKVVHSVRFWQDMPEAEIREFFRRRRTAR
jgi:hypothetical protein